MPTRAIKLKLIVPRGLEQRALAQTLWHTHATVNAAVHAYESALLLLRGRKYTTGAGDEIGEAQVQGDLEAFVVAAQQRNGAAERGIQPGLTEQIAADLRALYEAMVPSSIGQEGSAQACGAFVGPLLDAQSEGFESVFSKLEDLPNWLEGVRNGEADAIDAANAWATSDIGQARQRATGSPPTWVRRWRAGDADWASAFVEDIDKKRAEAAGTPSAVRRLRQAAVLPLLEPVITPDIDRGERTDGLTPWDRLAVRLAVAHLLSWESWCLRAADEHAKRIERVTRFRERYVTGQAEPLIAGLRTYETERAEELNRVAIESDRPFRITPRQLRAWPELREKWLRLDNPSAAQLLDISRAEQTRQRGRFGDAHLFAWLAQPEKHAIWRDAADIVGLVARLNAMEAIVERSRDSAGMTLPDARAHPRSVQWEAPGGSNLRTYRLRVDDGTLTAELPLLAQTDTGRLRDARQAVRLAPSGQLRMPQLENRGKQSVLRYLDPAGEPTEADIGSADLLFDRARTGRRPESDLAAGDIGGVWFKLALEPAPRLPEGWDGKRPGAAKYFQTARADRPPAADQVRAGLRVLSVDLGLRSCAACSVFELREERPPGKLAFPVDPPDRAPLWAVHERSFLLHLPGEAADARARQWRDQARAELRALRRGLNRYRRLMRLADLDDTARGEALDELAEALTEDGVYPFEAALLEDLRAAVTLPAPQWQAAAEQARATHRAAMRAEVRAWRRRTRARSADPEHRKAIGKSMWGIQYLTDVRRFLVSWSLAGRAPGDIRRLDRARRGIFASRLLAHIDNLKDDYRKTAADLIVQAARGYVRDKQGRWEQRFAPCPLVLFEDLGRYRMRTDRPRSENSQLMRWGHRALTAEVEMQGQLYGLYTVDTGAAFSSRYHAATGAPGIRCHALRDGDLEDAYFLDLINRDHKQPLDLRDAKSGDLVPLPGGEWFVAPAANGGLLRIHADINAAQNLQRRYWTRHADAFRLVCVRVDVDGQTRWVPSTLGKRLLGALNGPGMLVPITPDQKPCRWERLTKARWRRLLGTDEATDTAEAGTADPELAELEGLEEEHLERSGKVVVFFRDPSGVVLPADRWYPADVFWPQVKQKANRAMGLRYIADPA
jgi:hypothetical protein